MNQEAEEALHHLHEAMAYQAELLTPLDWDTWPQVCMAITKGKGTGKGNDNHAKGKGTGKGKDNHDAATLDHDALETLAALLNDHGTPLRIRRLRRYTNGEHGQPALGETQRGRLLEGEAGKDGERDREGHRDAEAIVPRAAERLPERFPREWLEVDVARVAARHHRRR